jgi:hypothetical protein
MEKRLGCWSDLVLRPSLQNPRAHTVPQLAFLLIHHRLAQVLLQSLAAWSSFSQLFVSFGKFPFAEQQQS